ncbi:O-antigen ligase [Pseudomonas sp. OIL-1]|uniref:O-antigen ligase family protein n=1 Tax=Pseudomonas sp. OIL-1 TaxID=2706126 RepID=UPI0013A75BC3|nr:O-antigen ligase family protein [Pseudomonas sp. OIL-1]QIB50790.1 O-antigen ligase family protein [Pseudomonas sp. OIL-1]
MTRYFKTAERLVLAGLLCLLVWLPLPLGSNRDWSAALLIFAVGSLACVWLILQMLQNLSLGSGFRKALLPLGLLVAAQAWVGLQLGAELTRDSTATFQYLMLGLAYCLLYMLVIGLFRTRKRLSVLLGVLVVSGVLQAFYGTIMTLSGLEWLIIGPKDHHVGHATGTFVNRNHLAGYLELTLAAGVGLLLALRQVGRFRWAGLFETMMGPKMRLRLALIIMVIGLVMTHSRMGNTAFFSSLLLAGGLFLLFDKEHRLRNGLLLASILLIDILIVSQYFGLDRLKERLVNTRLTDVVVDGAVVEQANELRGTVFNQALPLAADRPWVGQGAGSFETVFPPYAGGLPLHYDHAHNDFLQFFIEYGVVGSLPLVLFVLVSLFYALKAMTQQRSLYRSGVGCGAVLGIVALMLHSLTDFNLQIPSNAATYVVLCAIAVLANTHKVGSGRSKKKRDSEGGTAAADLDPTKQTGPVGYSIT